MGVYDQRAADTRPELPWPITAEEVLQHARDGHRLNRNNIQQLVKSFEEHPDTTWDEVHRNVHIVTDMLLSPSVQHKHPGQEL